MLLVAQGHTSDLVPWRLSDLSKDRIPAIHEQCIDLMFDITLLKAKQMSVAQGTPWFPLIHSLNFSDFFRSLGNQRAMT